MATVDGIKRFYARAEIVRVGEVWSVALDDRVVKTPALTGLLLPTEALAEMVAHEWNAQGETIDAATMPMFRSAATVIDRVVPKRDEVIAVTLKFGETDLLCYRAEGPSDLVERQAEAWQPWLEWAASNFGAELAVAVGLYPVNQPAAALAALAVALEALNNYELMGISAATAAAGSLVLGLALGADTLSPEDAAGLALLDDLYRVERWGDDTEAAKTRQQVLDEISNAIKFLKLCR